jgi:hypothetical protein
MLFSVRSRLTKAAAVCVLASFALLLVLPFGRVNAASAKQLHFRHSATAPAQAPPHRANEILVRFRTGASQADKDIAAVSAGVHPSTS